MKTFVAILIIILAGLTYGGLNYHFIRLDDGLKVLKKEKMTIEDTYVDARGMNKIKLFTNPSLVKAGIRDIVEK